MFKTLAFISAITSVVLAQNATSQANPLIPTGLSDSCTAFLQKLDSDSSFGTCLNAMNSATAAFTPGGSGTVSKGSISQTLGSLCADSVSSACPESLIRTTLTNFFTACPAELTSASKNSQVIQLYETLYLISPMRTSICSKDDSGDYCVFSSHGAAKEQGSDLSISSLMAQLYSPMGGALKRRAASAVVPNMQTYHDKNIAFLYFTPSLDASTLCTACARQVVTAFMNFESNVPYAPGLDNSQILNNQAPLVDAINNKCPAGFLNGAVQAAGGLSGGLFSSAAAPSVSLERKTVLAVAMGLATVVSFL